MNLLRQLVSGSVCLLVVGCAKPPPIQYYVEPAVGPGVGLISSELTESDSHWAPILGFLQAVDGDTVASPTNTENKKVAVAVGPHFLTVGCRMAAVTGSVSVPLEIKAGEGYVARCERGPYKMFLEKPYAFAWLQTVAGEVLTEKKVTTLDLSGGGSFIIPIIPIHR